MAKIIYTDSGRQVFRNFDWVRIIRPDGRMSHAVEFHGSILLGNEPRRLLTLLPDEAPKRTFLQSAGLVMLGFGIHALLHALIHA